MSIELYYSNQLNVLFECLNINLVSSYRHFKDPLDPDKVIVLNSHIRKWLQLKLAMKNGIVANVKFPFLEGVLWDLLETLSKKTKQIDLLDKEKLRIILYEFFLVKLPVELQILEKYINSSSSQKMKWARTWMLAEKIASLLMEYEYQRPDMIEKWMKGELYLSKEHQEIEIAQRYLYLYFLHPISGFLQKREKPLLTLFQYSKNVFSGPLPIVEDCKPIHIFAISQISVFHQTLLSKLKNHFDFHIYAFNPCCELWEDIKTVREDYKFLKVNREKNLKISDEELERMEVSPAAEDNHLLKSWGKTGREYIKLMSSLVDYNYYPGFIDEKISLENETVLQRVKRHILYRINGGNEEKIPQDQSLQIFNAPNITREVQTVFHSILHNLKEDSNLKLQDIVILVPNLDDYHSTIVSVFEGSSVPLKYGIAGSSAITDSLWAKGLLSIFEIGKGLMTREDVFQYLTNPCAMCKFNYNEDQIQKWSNWVDKLNIFHHFNEKHKGNAGFPDTLFFTWKQGLQRLRMGKVFPASNKSSISGYPFFIPEDTLKDDYEDLEKFVLILENLGEVVQDLQKNKSPQEWVEIISDISTRFLKVPSDLEEEIKKIPELLKKIQGISDFDVAAKELNSTPHLNLDMVYEILISALAVIESVKSEFMNGGVVISELQPMRPFPFKISYILGLGGASFPGRDVSFPLDLRTFKRKIGDISNSDRNRYLFLENFLSTTEKLYLSWVNRNLIKDEVLEPSSVILQLKRYLDTEVIRIHTPKEAFKVQSVPLQPYQIPANASCNNETTDLFHTFSLADHTHAQIINNGNVIEDLVEFASDVKKYFPTYLAPTTKETKMKTKYKLRANDLKNFLEYPSFAYMGYQLKIQESQFETEDPLAKNIEPLSMNRLQAYSIDKTIAINYFDFCRSQKNCVNFSEYAENLISRIKSRLAKQSMVGEGAFLTFLIKTKKEQIQDASGFYEAMANEIVQSAQYFPGIFFGVKIDEELQSCANQSLILPPIVISNEKFVAEISFDIRNCWQKEKSVVVAINKKSTDIKSNYYKDLLPALIAFAYSEADIFANADTLEVITSDFKTIKSLVEKPILKEYLLGLTQAFLLEENLIMLPGKLAVKLKDLIKTATDEEFKAVLEETIQSQMDSDYGLSVPDYLSLGNFEVSPNSRSLYQTRFAIIDFFESANKNEDN